MNFLQQVIKDSKNEYASLVSDGVAAGDVESFVDTGSYVFNALVSGSLFGGIPSNKITAIAGESGTGKTFFCLSVVRNFLNSNPDAGVIYFETESALNKQMIESRKIDSKRMVIFPIDTIEEFRTQAVRIIDKYIEQPKEERKPLMFVLDSLGMLATNKEVQDATDDKNVRDMTKAQLTKSVFRVLTLKLGKANIPMLVTNHTYDVIGSYVPQKEMGGGCLVAGTKIQTAKGSIPIESIQVGDKVRTMFGYSYVTNTFCFNDKEVFEMELKNGEIVKCSADHKFLVNTEKGYEWKKVIDLLPGDTIKCIPKISI
jgi:RecA/RadA recombinase